MQKNLINKSIVIISTILLIVVLLIPNTNAVNLDNNNSILFNNDQE